MAPTVLAEDVVDLDATRARRMPARGDVVLFRRPDRTEDSFVSRAVAIAGDRVQLRADGALEINGHALPRCDAGATPEGLHAWVERDGAYRYVTLHRSEPDPSVQAGAFCMERPCTVPAGHVFTLGDSRDNAFDGRFWGFVAVADIQARVRAIARPASDGPPARAHHALADGPVVAAAYAPRVEQCRSALAASRR